MSTKALLLAGGIGSRLSPLTDTLPKCLMPIRKKPLLEFWIDKLLDSGIDDILVNVHHFPEIVIDFLQRDRFKNSISWVYEKELLGTAGTLKKNRGFFSGSDILLVHADNFCTADLNSFISSHREKSEKCIMSMMTFFTDTPESCGIVQADKDGIVTDFFEKMTNPTSNYANAAVYLLNKDFYEWLNTQGDVFDFSVDIIPSLMGRINTWNNDNLHIDIGTIESLMKAQALSSSLEDSFLETHNDRWFKSYLESEVHQLIDQAKEVYG